MSEIIQPQYQQSNNNVHRIMNIPLKMKEKILRSKLTRINEFLLNEVSSDPLYLDVLADEYKFNCNNVIGSFEFVKFLELYFGRIF